LYRRDGFILKRKTLRKVVVIDSRRIAESECSVESKAKVNIDGAVGSRLEIELFRRVA
jgi:hypothetical protein